jgi:hypothetical protein
MGAVPQGVSKAQWRMARLRACHKHLIDNRSRALVRDDPKKIRIAFVQGWCDSSANVASFITKTRYCGYCGGIGTLPGKPRTVCIHCRRGRKRLADMPVEEALPVTD